MSFVKNPDAIYICIVRNGVEQRIELFTNCATLDIARSDLVDATSYVTLRGYIIPDPACRKPNMSDPLIFGASATK